MREEEEGIRKRAAEQYMKVVEKISGVNEATGGYLLMKLQNKIGRANIHWLQGLIEGYTFTTAGSVF